MIKTASKQTILHLKGTQLVYEDEVTWIFLIWTPVASWGKVFVFMDIFLFMALAIMSMVTSTRTVMVAPTKMTTRVGISSG